MRDVTTRALRLLVLLVLVHATGCKKVAEPPVDPHAHGEEHAQAGHAAEAGHAEEAGVVGGAATEHGGAGEAIDPFLQGALRFVASEDVVGRTGPGGIPFQVARRTSERVGHQREIGTRSYAIALRATNLTYYPCSSCHVDGVVVGRGRRALDAHQDIQPVHPSENNAVCVACHVADNPAWLNLTGTDPVPLNQAYRLCAQCHFVQVQAWAGGGHGKRLDRWQGPRVVMGCTDCHNPHDPGIPTRIPYPGPRVPRTGPKQP